MPKFMTYQRPTPVNKANWTGRTDPNPFQPLRRTPPAVVPGAPQLKPVAGPFK